MNDMVGEEETPYTEGSGAGSAHELSDAARSPTASPPFPTILPVAVTAVTFISNVSYYRYSAPPSAESSNLVLFSWPHVCHHVCPPRHAAAFTC